MRRLLAFAALAACLGACSHRPPARHITASHGVLLSARRVDAALPQATTYRIRYTSRSVAGKPIEVTGLAVVPDAPARNKVVLAFAHGTTGLADVCAPSAAPTSSEALAAARTAVANGWILAATDYEGLGTPGRHPYLVGASEGRSVLDAALAAHQLPHADAGRRTLIAGYSQGGHAALWANQLARTWAPSLDVVGTFAGAPATEVDRILEAGRTEPIQEFVLAIVGGYAAAYSNADPAAYLTARGVEELAFVDRGCLGSVQAKAATTSPEDLVRPDGPTNPAWLALARENNPGSVAGESPVLIVHSDQDDVVPVELSRILHERMCAHHEVVERRVIHAGGHAQAALRAFDLGNQWMLARLRGVPAKTDCSGR